MKKFGWMLLPLILCLTLFACDLDSEIPEYNSNLSDGQQNESIIDNSPNNDAANSDEEKIENNNPVHVHTWIDATCSAPKTCSDCGTTEGTTADHNWISATCSAPKTCSDCGATEGKTADHNWITATCTSPKSCSKCNATEGKANGHSWKEATCSEPKTCTTCGTTSGLTAGHNFSNGKCTTCGKADPDYNKEAMVWIPTNGGTKYHSKSNCSNMKNPVQVTQSEAETRGFTPCSKCH